MATIVRYVCLAIAMAVSAAAHSEPIKVGVVLPLSGTASTSGVTVQNSIQLAVEQAGETGGVRFLFEDDQLTPRLTVAAVNKLILVDKVQGLIVFGSPTSLAVSALADEHKVPMIALSIVDKVVAGRTHVVKFWVSARAEHQLVLRQIRTLGYQRIAVVATINDAMLALKSLITSEAPERVVVDLEVSREEVDLRPLVVRTLRAKPDAIYNLLWSPHPGLFAKLVRASGFTGPIFGVHNLEDPMEIKSAAGALTGSWFVTGDDRSAVSFRELYQKRYGSTPSAGGVNSYDAAMLFIQGFKSGDANRYLHTVSAFHGAHGTYSASGANDFTIEALVKTIDPRGAIADKVLR